MTHRLKLMLPIVAASALAAGIAAAASSPTVATGGTMRRGDFSAVLTGVVNPNGGVTKYEFKYGTSTTYDRTSPVRVIKGGVKPRTVQIFVSHLLPGTTYHYQLIAFNKYGTGTGSDRTFKTKGNPPPGATTGSATSITTNSAYLTGVITPSNETTTYFFQWGSSTAYQNKTLPPQTVPAGTTPVPVSIPVTTLPSGTIIHFRLVAVHKNGSPQYGADSSFMTFPSPAPVPTISGQTKPKNAKHKPFRLTTSGRIIGPSSIPSQYACTRGIRVTFRHGGKIVARQVVPLQPDCTFTAQTTFRHLPGRHHKKHEKVVLKVYLYFGGNGYLARKTSGAEKVTLG